MSAPIEVTTPHLPPFEEFARLAAGAWERGWLTNNGPLLLDYQKALRQALGCEAETLCTANGGLALQVLLRALDIGGEVITTPFSYVATTACPLWEGCRTVFADIDRASLCLDPAAVEAAITPRTEAVVATHVFGNPCEVGALESICAKHGLALVFDAAHAFGVRHRGRSIVDHGDGSIISLHATKIIHSGEGGLIATRRAEVAERAEWMRRFGHDGPYRFQGVGINAKMSELHAALGLAVLAEWTPILEKRHTATTRYRQGLDAIDGLRFAFDLAPETDWNSAYMPVLFDTAAAMHAAAGALRRAGYGTRRYFHPSLDTLELGGDTAGECPVSHDIASRVLCLPLSTEITADQIDAVLEILARRPSGAKGGDSR